MASSEGRERRVKQSKRVGRVQLRNGGGYDGYEALVEIDCAECGEAIQPGEAFVRIKRVGGGHANLPHCQRCEPHFTGDVSPGNRDSTRFRWREL